MASKVFVYVISLEGVIYGINFTSFSENGNEVARGAAKCYFAIIATAVEFFPKFQSYFQTRFHIE